MRRIKIVVVPGYYVPHIGGLETHVDEFAKYLSQDERFSITVVAPNIPRAPKEEVRHSRVRVVRYPAFEAVSGYPIFKFWNPSLWKVLLQLKRERPDFVMTRTRFFFSSFAAAVFAKKILKTNLIHVEHGSSYVTLQSRIKTKLAYKYDRTFGRYVIESSDLVIAVSKAVKSFLEREFQRKDSVTIRRGIEIQKIDSIRPERAVREFSIGFVGRLLKWKGVDKLIEAFSLLDRRVQKRSRLIVAGYGEDFFRLKRLAQSLLSDRALFVGKVSFERAIALTKGFDVFVHSSEPGGGLATTLLQAMACSRPVVASPHEGGREVVFNNENGLLLSDNSAKEIARGIEELFFNEKARKVFGLAARRFVETNFSWPRQIRLFKRVLSERFDLEFLRED